MKTSTSAILLAMMLATGAAAQSETTSGTASGATPPPAEPDYSREGLIRIFSVDQREPERRPAVEIHPGWIDFTRLGTRVRFSPFFAPLQGSEFDTSRQWPDPFALTGTQIAMTPANFRRTRETNAELRALEKRIRKSNKVKVSGQ